jgi:hypothetical protein
VRCRRSLDLPFSGVSFLSEIYENRVPEFARISAA